MRWTTLVMAICLTGLWGCGPEKAETPPSERDVLRIGTDATYPPFETVNPETGKPQGFDIDLITAICEVNGWRPEFVVTPFDGIIPGLRAHKYDAVISAVTITERRAAVVNFSDPYYVAGQIVAVPLQDNIIHGVDDLVGKRVGVQLGTTGELMAKRLRGLQVFSYDNIGSAFIDMSNGNLDAIINDHPTTMAYINRHATAKTVGELLSTERYGIAVRPDSDELLAMINEALQVIRESGTLDSINMVWFGRPAMPIETDQAEADSLHQAPGQ